MAQPLNAGESTRDLSGAGAPASAPILIVDDNVDQLVALEAILAPLGQPVVRARSGEEALRRLLTETFAVILLDVRMAGMSGLETARAIKGRERTRFIPIIFITGADSHEETQVGPAYSTGAVDYVFKPVRPDILRSKVSVFVDLYRQQQRLAAQERRLREADRHQLELTHAQELLRSEREYREILETAFDAIVIFDGSGSISMINHAAEQMFGVPAGEAIGTPVARFFADEEDRSFHVDDCVERDAERRPTLNVSLSPRAYMARRANGETFPSEASVSCIDGSNPRYTLIVRDVSERTRQAQALQDAVSARSRFLTAMSHELRTPINAVLGFNELLLEGVFGALNEKQSESVRRAQRAARHLLDLVNDVLDLSKIEAGKLDVHWEQFDVREVIDEVVATLQPLADESGSSVSVEYAEDGTTVTSDKRFMHQIALNLLSNAIKYGLGKPIHVVARPRDESRPNAGTFIDVVDQGPGLAPEEKERIFDEFEQVGRAREKPGTGMGLSISRRLAAVLGGSLEVESEREKGSTFRLCLPARRPRVRRAQDRSTKRSARTRGQGMFDNSQ